MKEKKTFLADEVKLQVIQEYLQTDITINQLMQKYGFSGYGSISQWMRKFGVKSPDKHQIKLNQYMAKESAKTKRERELEEEINKLKKELDHEKLRSLALDTMINIAERELKISIRKKSGPKR